MPKTSQGLLLHVIGRQAQNPSKPIRKSFDKLNKTATARLLLVSVVGFIQIKLIDQIYVIWLMAEEYRQSDYGLKVRRLNNSLLSESFGS